MSIVMNESEKIPFEDALSRTGFGLYSYVVTGLAGVVIISFACIFFASTIVVPVSACDLKTTGAQQGMLAAGPIVGCILGAMVWGYLADKYGRRNTLMVSLTTGAVVNALASLSVGWIMLLVLQFIASLMIAGQYSLAMTFLSESVPLAKRNLVVLLVSSILLLSQGVMAVLAMPIIPLTFSFYIPHLDIWWNSWRLLLMVYSVPSLVCALWLYFMQESPKFVYSKGDEVGALEIMRNIYNINHRKQMGEFQVKALLRRRSYTEPLSSRPASNHVLSLFRPPLLKYTTILTLLSVFEQVAAFKVWLPTIAHKFVQILETGGGSNLTLCDVIAFNFKEDLADNENASSTSCALNMSALLMVLVVSVTLSLSNTGVSLMVGRVGRRNMAMIITAVCGVSGVLVNLVPNAIASAALFVLQLNGIVVLGIYTALCVALFPTHLRALAVTLIMTGGRIGNFVSIQLIKYLFAMNCEVAFYTYGSVLALSAVVASFLPNDRKIGTPRHQILQNEECSRC